MNSEEKKVKMKFNILAIICIAIFCFVLAPVTLQNDTYYTIKIGEHIIENGIDMQDPFSWHEDLPYTYPHWAYDTSVYLIYNLGEMTQIENGGMIFIHLYVAVLSSILGIVMYKTILKISKNNLMSFFFTILTMYLLDAFIAARAQLVTFILFMLTILFIENFLESKKKRYLLGIILISIVIANVHVAVWPFFFILFLPYIAEYIIALILDMNIIAKLLMFEKESKIRKLNKKVKVQKDEEKKKELELKLKQAEDNLILQKEKVEKVIEKENTRRENPYKLKIEKNSSVKWLILVMIICAFTGLLTPLGDTPYTYLVKTMQGNTMNSISEHQPLTLYNDKQNMIVMAVVLAILIFTDTKIKLREFFMIAGLLFLSFMSRRQLSLFLLIGVPIFTRWIDCLIKKYDENGCDLIVKFMNTIYGKILTIVLVMLISLCFVKPKLNDVFVDTSKYPVDASTWILENLDIENIRLYNEYNYGSYLLFRGIPVFIDSRADLYAPEFNKTEENEEGRDIFSDYINISSIGTYYENKFEKYDITHVIVVNNAKLNMFLSRNNDYKEIYKDDYFVIYERNV